MTIVVVSMVDLVVSQLDLVVSQLDLVVNSWIWWSTAGSNGQKLNLVVNKGTW